MIPFPDAVDAVGAKDAMPSRDFVPELCLLRVRLAYSTHVDGKPIRVQRGESVQETTDAEGGGAVRGKDAGRWQSGYSCLADCACESRGEPGIQACDSGLRPLACHGRAGPGRLLQVRPIVRLNLQLTQHGEKALRLLDAGRRDVAPACLIVLDERRPRREVTGSADPVADVIVVHLALAGRVLGKHAEGQSENQDNQQDERLPHFERPLAALTVAGRRTSLAHGENPSRSRSIGARVADTTGGRGFRSFWNDPSRQ